MTRIVSFSGKHSFLSNFSPALVYISIGIKWLRCPTVEHAFQASKTYDHRKRTEIVAAPTPLAAKRLGHSVRRLEYWDDIKQVVMLELLRQKFSRSALRHRLLRTDHIELIEGNNWHDNFWGVCACEDCFDKGVPGQNRLGYLLMRVRKDIR